MGEEGEDSGEERGGENDMTGRGEVKRQGKETQEKHK